MRISPTEKVYYTISVRDRYGKLLNKPRRTLAHSLLRAYNDALYCHFDQTSIGSLPDTSNTDRTITYNSANNFDSVSAISDTTHGIVVGTGTTAVTITDYALGTLIDEGVGAGQMNYQACTASATVVSGSSAYFRLQRSVNNNSGADITVTEIGVYSEVNDNGAAVRYFCFIRDVLLSSSTVPDGGTITVTYNIIVSV